MEILFGAADGVYYCLNFNGSVRWTFTCKDTAFSNPVVADLDGDGSLEVLFGSLDGLYCLD
jgi:hypothetical protein